jgi:hypothetical protein
VALGALATLFDATALAYSNEYLLNTLPGLIVYLPLPSSGKPAMADCDLDILGHHYFDSAGTPTFNLSTLNKIGYVGKIASINAPASANKGPAGTGAVPWLQLNKKTGYTSVGISQVYRVETAGGNPELTCVRFRCTSHFLGTSLRSLTSGAIILDIRIDKLRIIELMMYEPRHTYR